MHGAPYAKKSHLPPQSPPRSATSNRQKVRVSPEEMSKNTYPLKLPTSVKKAVGTWYSVCRDSAP